METRIVKKPHTASYDNPIVFAKGARLRVTERTDLWDGYTWLWAVAVDGREGWIPDDLIVDTPIGQIASKDYSAVELSCMENEPVQVLNRSHGWAWCENSRGKTGWVPLKNLLHRG